METLRILIGSCGGLTGLYLAKSLRKLTLPGYSRIELFGFDANGYVPTKFFVDNFFVVSRASKKNDFVSDLINLLNTLEIDVYIPTHSEECRTISEMEQHIRYRTNTRFLISPFSTFQKLDNKGEAYEVLSSIGIKTPKVYKRIDEVENFPVIAKPRVGSGSKEVFKVSSIEELSRFHEAYKSSDLLFVEYLSGSEYTVDAFFDSSGNLVTYNQRIRLKTLGGAVIVTKNDFSVDVKEYIEKISEHFKIVGPANFQFFLTPSNEIVFTDINLRFASGGLPLSVESGANIVELVLLEALDIEYDPKKYQSDRKNRVMYRYFEEVFEEL